MSNVKTAGKYEGFVKICSGFGGYHPGSPNLQLSALQELSAKARHALEEKDAARSAWKKATNEREIAFAGLKKLVSAVLYALAASGASEQAMKDARVFLRQISGRRKSREPIPSEKAAGPVIKARPALSGGFEVWTNHLSQLVEMLSQETSYQPNEPHLSVAGLKDLVTRLQQHNTSVKNAQANFFHARVALHEVFYGETNSIVATARAVKKYLRSVYGLNSNEYSQVRKIIFNKPKI
jgi:hypothetical protein